MTQRHPKTASKSSTSTLHGGRSSFSGNQIVLQKESGQGWVVRGGAGADSRVFRKQSEAIHAAREIMRNLGGGEVIVHAPGGTIRRIGVPVQTSASPADNSQSTPSEIGEISRESTRRFIEKRLPLYDELMRKLAE